jgi:hypothetical protein
MPSRAAMSPVSGSKQDDLYLSTLGEYVEALGGRLEVRAVFPDQVIALEVRPGHRLHRVAQEVDVTAGRRLPDLVEECHAVRGHRLWSSS